MPSPRYLLTWSIESVGCMRKVLGTPFANNAMGTAERAMFFPVVVHEPVTVYSMFWINGTTINGNVDVGVYDTAGHLLVSTGSTAQSGSALPQEAGTTDTP